MVQTLKLRLHNGEQGLEFTSNPSEFRRDFINAFTRFRALNLGKSAQLEVKHSYHGWHTACLNGTYPIVSSPILLDFEKLLIAVLSTLNECDHWPTKAEKRQQEALRRRSKFHVIST